MTGKRDVFTGGEFILAVMITVLMLSSISAKAEVNLNFPGGRIALTFDGNQHDLDDVGALPMSVALLDAADLVGSVVHLNHSNHLGDNDSSREQKMIDSADGSSTRFGLPQSKIWDCQTDLNNLINDFAAHGNASSASDPLWYICAGPMEVAWRCVNAVDPAKRQYVHLVSHSSWNENHADTTQMTHTWNDIANMSNPPVMYEIADQNSSDGDYDWNTPEEYWYWLRDHDQEKYRWVFSRDQFSTKFDPSDAGMVYWLITGGPNGGDDHAGWPEAEELFSNPVIQGPYGGTARFLPGSVEAEDYDIGGEGIAYHDTSSGNNGGAYRTDDVDIEACSEGGYNVGWMADGEWLEYTVNIADGIYDIDLRLASKSSGRTLTVKLGDGTTFSTLGTAAVPNTEGWQNWQTVTLSDVSVSNGSTNKILRLEIGGGSFNINHVAFASVATQETAVNCGGGTSGEFAADALFSGGRTYSTSNSIDTSGVDNPALEAVYQTERYGNFTYTISGLAANTPYTVRLHLAEIYFNSTGQRLFDVKVNNALVLNDYDIFSAAGGKDIAVVESFSTDSNGSGEIVVQFISVVDNSKCSGIEITGGSSLVASTFDSNSESFSYMDDEFGTSQPAYADGTWESSAGFDGGALKVTVGGVDAADITNMSGGWEVTFNVPSSQAVTVSFAYRAVTSAKYEADEYCDVLMSIDGTLVGEGGNDFIDTLNSGTDTGWVVYSGSVGTLSAGNHTLAIGAFNNKKTTVDEFIELWIDSVLVE